MTGEYSEALWPDERETLPLRALAELSGLSEDELLELIDCGALAPFSEGSGQHTFSAVSITVARTARRLRDDFELDPHGVAVLLAYVERIRELEAQLRALRARLPR
ncbi:MAG TPA: chaperone modulator CbpM [Casimicrobiaceae bacterium]|nr:chaperone modulator CbpM [Casimicrobiaceae bacterium]